MNIINMYYTPLEARKLNLGALEIYRRKHQGKPEGVNLTYDCGVLVPGDLTIDLDGNRAEEVKETVEAILSIPVNLA